MFNLFNIYDDILIMDSTLGKNVFNMPLVTLVGIDNFGKSRIFAFCLMSNETKVSYKWLCEGFKDIMQKIPKIVYVDEMEAQNSGYLTINCYFYNLY